MSQTIEVIVEPNGAIRPLEEIHVTVPTRALLTLPETATPAKEEPERGTAAALLQFLKKNRLPPECRRSAEEIEAGIREEREAWESSGDGQAILALLQTPRYATRPPADPEQIERRIKELRNDWDDE